MNELTLKKALIREKYPYRVQYSLWILLYGKNDFANFFKEFPPEKIEYEKITVSANELKKFLMDNPDEFTLKGEQYSAKNILKKHPAYIKFLAQKEALDYATEENIIYIKDVPESLLELKNMKKAKRRLPLSKEEYFKIPDEKFCDLWEDGSSILEDIPKERWTKNLLDIALDALLIKNMSVSYAIKAPDELKTEKYWRVLCTVNGYYFRILPKEYQYILSEEFILNALKQNRSFVGYFHLLSAIPDQFKTHDVCLYACTHHFAAAEHLPKSLRNDVFYNELIDNGMVSFINFIDLKTISARTFEKALMQNKEKNLFFKGKLPNYLCTEKTVKLLAIQGCIDSFPNQFKTRDVWLLYAQSNQVDFKKIPEKFIDEQMALLAMKGNAFAVRKQLPEYVKTDKFFDVLIKYGLYYSPNDIPEKYWNAELIIKKAHDIYEIPDAFLNDEVVIPVLKKHGFITPADIKRYQSKGVYNYTMDSLKDKTLYCYYLKLFKRKYWKKEHLDYALKNDPQAIFLPELTDDEIKISLTFFPDNIIYVSDLTELPGEEKLLPDDRQQLTIFDYI